VKLGRLKAVFAALALAATTIGVAVAAPAANAGTGTVNDVVRLAEMNVGGSACGTNSLGGHSFYTSCTGDAGRPQFWCADFAMWVWANSGETDMNGLSAAAQSFYTYGRNRGILTNQPAVGDAVVFSKTAGDTSDDPNGIHHVAIVTAVYPNGTIETVSGDWDGQDGNFAATSHVVHNTPAYGSAVGTRPSVMGMWIEGYIPPPGLVKRHADMDFSGDGSADLLTETPAGDLHYFPNNSALNAGGRPFLTDIVTGTGFQTATHILEGDISGDGSADLLTETPTGDLRYFPNNGASNPGGVLFTNYISTGSGWDPDDRLFLADISGDGSDDLLATKPDGTLLYCPNNGASNPGGAPFTTCNTIGSGWQTATRMFVADFSGDHRADIVSMTADGQLRYFHNNGGAIPFNSYIVTGTGFDTATGIWAADFSGDGAADLLTETSTGELRYFPNNASTNPGGVLFTNYIVTGTGFGTADRIFPIDLSGDGAADLLTTTTGGDLRYFPNNGSTNPGGALFTNYIDTGTGFTPDNLIIVDHT
jgi:hypothetical protein